MKTWIVTPLVKTFQNHVNVEVLALTMEEARRKGAREMGLTFSQVAAVSKYVG